MKMKGAFHLVLALTSCAVGDRPPLVARTIWNGPRINFSKANNTDPSQAQNQDRITDTVWITRGNTMGIYNAAQESGYTASSPLGTRWATGTTADIDSLVFTTWLTWTGGPPNGPPGAVGRDAVLHLVAQDIYIDIRFTSWTQRSGGGFSYTRSSPSPLSAPAFTQHPQSITAEFGSDVTFTVAVSGMPEPTLQWQRDGQPLAGQTAATLLLGLVTLDEAGSYTCVATNSEGSVTSNAATLSVNPPTAPEINVQPEAMISLAGTGAFFSIQASGFELTYQWRKDGADLAGATGPTLFLEGVLAADAGAYSCVVANPGGSIVSAEASLSVVPAGTARLTNLSARAVVGTGDDLLIPGFVLAGTGNKTLLVRAVGPRLGLPDFGVAGVLSDPMMEVSAGSGALVASNDDWGGFSDQDALAQATLAAGAFELTPSTKDAALLLTLPAQSYTVRTSGVGGLIGVALVEVYDRDPASSTSRLSNLSARAQVGTGGDILIPGFVIEGDVALTLLIRGVGPTLNSDFGVAAALADPVMTVFRGADALARNDDWEQAPNQPALLAATAQTGAFELGAGQKDAALLVALNPGAYTVQVEGKAGGVGVALVELFVVAP